MSENLYTDRTRVTSNRSLKNHEKIKLEIPELKKRKNRVEKKLTEVEGSLQGKLFFPKKEFLCKLDLEERI